MGPKQKQKRKHNKDPLRPKRPTSAYFYFAKACREELRAQGKAISKVSEFTKEVSAKWKVLDDKSTYAEEASRDKARFDAENAVYKGNKPQKKKRACTAYFHFLADFRKKPVAHGLHIKEISTQAGAAWRALTDADKQPYQVKYELQRKQIAEDEAKLLTAGITGATAAPHANGAVAVEEEEEFDDDEEEEEEDEDDE